MILNEEISILLRLLLAHLLTDFVFQPSAWVAQRNSRKYRSGKLYFHAFLTAFLAWFFAGIWTNLWIPLTIFISHLLIDLWKSYQPAKLKYFILDQLAHLLVILLLWTGIFDKWALIWESAAILYDNNSFLITAAGYLFVTWPLGIMIGIATERWRNEPGVNTDGLAKAGLWIGFFERFLIFTFILIDQYTAIGFLIAAKSVLRFNDKENSTQKKTEYVLIGTLMSFSASLVIGLAIRYLLALI